MATLLVAPSIDHLPGYVAALRRGWSPDTVRGPETIAEQLRAIDDDPVEFLAGLNDETAGGDPVATFEDEDGTEVRVYAERITYDPVANIAVAKENVRVLRETMEATAGIVRFERDESRVIFREEPVIVDGLPATSVPAMPVGTPSLD